MTDTLDAIAREMRDRSETPFVPRSELFAWAQRITALSNQGEGAVAPDAYNRKLRAQLEQEWVELRSIRRAEQPQVMTGPDDAAPVAWRSKDYQPWATGGYTWAYTHSRGDVTPDHEPLYLHPAEADRRDAERLDYMVHRGANIDCYKGAWTEATVYRVTAFGSILTEWHDTYRDAIDAAIAATQEQT